MLPNFFVAGVEKSGTTSMHRSLRAHPDVYMSPVKEPGYFGIDPADPPPIDPRWPYTKRIPRDRAAYEDLFAAVTTEAAVGEATTSYFQSEWAMRRIRDEIPGARIVVLLRDPAERAWSAHTMYVARGFEPITDFDDALAAEAADPTGWRAYLRNGFYAESVARSLEWFGRDRVRILLTDDFRADPGAVMREVLTFLGVDSDVPTPTDEHHNVATATRHTSITRLTTGRSGIARALRRVLPASARASMKRKAQAWNRIEPEPLPTATRDRLVAAYADDIERTASLIGRDLSGWKTV